jgi:transcriptional regulator with XRE-family HTH domain
VDSIKKVLGNRIRELRKSRGISAETLAERLEVHANTVYTLERGQTWVSAELLDRLSSAFSVNVAFLFADVPESSPTPQQAVEVLRDALEGPPLTSIQREILGVIGALDEAKARQWLSAIRLEQSPDLTDSEDFDSPQKRAQSRRKASP